MGLFALNRRHSRTKSTFLKMCAGKTILSSTFSCRVPLGSLCGGPFDSLGVPLGAVGRPRSLFGLWWALCGRPFWPSFFVRRRGGSCPWESCGLPLGIPLAGFGSLWSFIALVWVLCGRSWAPLVSLWTRLGSLWAPFPAVFFLCAGAVVRACGTLLASLRGSLWRLFGCLWSCIGVFWIPFGRSWASPGALWSLLGPPWACL